MNPNMNPGRCYHVLIAVMLLLVFGQANAQSAGEPGKPAWISPNKQSTDSGSFRLEWTPPDGEFPELYRLAESFNGTESFSYVSGSTLDLDRSEPGDYSFSLQACLRDHSGVQSCGASSKPVRVTVTEEFWADSLVTGRPVAPPAPSVSEIPGGPDQLRPGLWHNPLKVGQGWSIYWANRLSLSQNPSNAYDLFVIWYTFEAKRLISYCDGPNDTCPPLVHEYYDYRPVLVTMSLAKDSASNNFIGGVYIKRKGVNRQVGNAIVSFGASNSAATITWDADFKKQANITDTDSLQLLAGSSGSSSTDVSYLAGLWGDTSANQYIVDNVGSLSEAVEAIFYDNNGDPTWIQAYRNQVPVATDTSLCFYHVQGGSRPDLDQTTLQGTLYSSCDPDNTTSTNRNGRRYFDSFEAARYWISFNLPPGVVDDNAVAGGSLNIGSASAPSLFAKSANFHRIWFAGLNSCQVSTTSPTCVASLTWFTDGDYRNATAYANNQSTAQRTLIATSLAPTMQNQPVTLSAAGTHVFELRMSNSPTSTLMAVSPPFTVTMVSGSPVTPTNLAALWTNETTRNYSVQWIHPDSVNVAHYTLEETVPGGSVTVYTVSPGTTLSRAFSRSTGPFGTYSYRVRACNSASSCSNYTSAINWIVTDPTAPPPTGGIQKPWGTNAYGNQVLDQPYNYALGYHFKPSVNGQVTQLGGLFNGVKTVKLFRRDSGSLLAQATVSSANTWSYVSIAPVAVTAGVEYTVAGYLAGSGASYRSGLGLPKTYGDITILAGTSISTSTDPQAIPTNNNTMVIYGQVDIAFQAAVPQLPPSISPVGNQVHAEGQLISLQVIASDPDGTITSYTHGATLPPGLGISNSGLITGTLAAGSAAGSPYSVTITATDNSGLTDQETFTWTVNPPNPNSSVTVFSDSFEDTQSGPWTQDSQNDWLLSTQRARTGSRSAEVDGLATDAQLISNPINLQGSTQATVNFNWYIESGLDSGEYLAFDVSTNGGTSWSERARVRGNVDPEDAWRPVQLNLTGLSSLRLRFRGTMSASDEDANVDDVVVTVPAGSNNSPPVITSPGDQNSFTGSTITNFTISVTDTNNDPYTCTITGLPAGLQETAECIIGGVITATPNTYAVTVTANDGKADSLPISFNWTISSAGGTANPETPPAPAGAPNMTPDATSSRVGATAGVFRVDDSGNATYTIPIHTAPGSGGRVPQISLNYSSQAGNSPLGMGWSLGGVSAITRCSRTLEQDGNSGQRGISLTANDRFCLDGQRLIAVSGAYGAVGSEYRSEIDAISKIVSSGTAGAGPQSFTVWHKDGTVIQYGGTTDSRIEARTLTDSQTVLTWAQNRLTDLAGNYIDYVYNEFAGAGGDPVEFVLANIRYTGNTNAATTPYAQLDFIYDTNRPDSTVMAAAGAQQVRSRLLKRIDSRSRVSAATSLLSLRSYHLAYHLSGDGYGRAILTSITECNDSSKTYCFMPTTFDWQRSKHQVSSSNITIGSVFSSKSASIAMADTNGDGRPDLLLTEKSGSAFVFRVALAQVNGSFASPGSASYAIPNNGLSTTPVSLHAIDLNADGFQDVIYPTSSGWKARLADGSGFGTEISVSSACCSQTNPPLVRIIDFDGDGLSDLLTTRAAAGTGIELVLLRNTFSPASPNTVSLSSPQLLAIDVSSLNLFPAQSSDGWLIDTEAPQFDSPNAANVAFARPFDYNGDGAVDLLVRLSQRYVQCGSGCVPNLNSPAAQSAPLTRFTFDASSTQSQTTQQASATYAWASFYLVLLSEGNTAFAAPRVVATAADCLVLDACRPFAALPVARRALPVDINGDGLADMAWQDALFDWYARINSGDGFLSAAISIANFDGTAQWQYGLSHFLDITGDGLPELIYPNLLDNANAVWLMHENLHGKSFAAAAETSAKFGKSSEFDKSILVDANGDSMLDNLFIDLNAQGVVQSSTTKVYLGQNSITGGSVAHAANLISGITNGFGANTTITYKCLTDSSVYTRMRDGKNALWGAGSVVYDLVAPLYVVSQADQSAPVYGSSTAINRKEYRYIGARLQGGGRGFLGFSEVITYDPQLSIRTNARYRQDFPYIGLSADTTLAKVTTSQKLDAISNTTTTNLVNWATVSAATQAPALPSGILLGYAVNQWAATETVSGKKTWFPYIANSLERSYSLGGDFSKKVLTTNSYSGYGDLTSTVVYTYASDGSNPFSTQTSSNTYLAADTANWRLGRLGASSVTHARSGLPSITRQFSFAYDATSGILNQEVIEPNNTAFRVATSYQLDAFGNRLATAVSGSGFSTRGSSSGYDPLGRFMIKATNAYNQVTRQIISWDAHGNALAVDNVDGVSTTSAADYMGRPFIAYTQTGSFSKTLQSSSTISHCVSSDTAFYTVTTGAGQPSTYQCYDRLGREIRTATQGFDGSMVYVDRYYDASGRPERISEPYFSGATRYWNETAYDALGRVDSVLSADGNDMTYDYDQAATACSITGGPRQTKTTNGLNQSQFEQRNAAGETTAVYDNNCGKVSYSYDAVGHLIQLTGADGAVTTTEYDVAGRKTKLIDPDKGTWQYAYNPLGELIRQLDGKNQAIDFSYDLLGRVTERREISGTSSLTPGNGAVQNSELTTWNNSTSASVMGKSQITSAVYRSGTGGAILHQRDYGYDSFGRPSVISTSLDGLVLSEETTYDQFGRVFQQFDASGDERGIRYHYNTRGYIEKLQEAREGTNGTLYQYIQGMDERGNVTYQVLGNGVEVFATHQASSGRIQSLEAYDAQGRELQFVTYDFDVAGNLKSRHDTSGSNSLNETFRYDLLNRLEEVFLSAGGATAQSTLRLQYGASGNINFKSGVGNISYGSTSSRPHAVTSAGPITYSYDANGNQTSSSDGRSISYTVFDQARRIARATESTEFSYGIGNQRIRRVDDNAVDELRSTWTFGNTERITQNGGNPFFKRYLGDIAIADFYPGTQVQTVQYLVKDHLGSVHTLVDSGGTAWPMHFSAFGERQNVDWVGLLSPVAVKFNNLLTTRGFTGHEHADGLGIIHMNGRIYDPKLGRFLQADPFVQSPKNSQSLNRYTYVYNNPLSYTDPSGYFGLSYFVKKWWRVAAAAVVSYFTYGAANGWAATWLAGTATATNSLAIGAIAGGVAGFVGGAIISGTLKGAFQGAVAGGLMGGVAGYFGDTYSVARIGADTLAGGISAEIYGQKFKDGVLFGALISGATYLTVKLRAYQKANSELFPGQIGESKGFRGIDGKIAGERIFEQDWIDSGAAKAIASGKPLDWVIEYVYLPYEGNLSPLGGFQGGEGLVFGKNYKSGSLFDYILEGYSGVHDTLNQPYFYTPNGTNRTLSGFWQKGLGYMINPADVLIASPVVLPGLVPDYLRYIYFQERDQ